MTVTVDASVWVAADIAAEADHQGARAMIRALIASGEPMQQPSLTLVEVVASIARRTRDPELARDAAGLLMDLPDVTFHRLDLDAAMDAAALAASAGLRAADAVYLATAMAWGSTLITLDRELIERAPAGIVVMTPVDWLAARRA